MSSRRLPRFGFPLAAVAVFVTLVGVPSAFGQTVPDFEDVPQGHVAEAAIRWAAENEVTVGMGDNRFGIGETLTRYQMVTFLCRAFDPGNCQSGVRGSDSFDDVPAGHWAEYSVGWAANRGITSGVSATEFGGAQTLTREQMITFLYRAEGSPTGGSDGSDVFQDAPDRSHWANLPIGWAFDEGVTGGIAAGTFGFGTDVSREEMVLFLCRTVAPGTCQPSQQPLPSSVVPTTPIVPPDGVSSTLPGTQSYAFNPVINGLRMHSDGGAIQREIIEGFPLDAGHFIWSRDGTRVAYRVTVLGSPYWVANADLTNQQLFTRAATGISWSPDGTKLLLELHRSDGVRWESSVRVMNADGTDHGIIDYGWDETLVWSPDGTRIAFFNHHIPSEAPDIGSGVFLVDSDGTNRQRIVTVVEPGITRREADGHIRYPPGTVAWSPDGTRIAYSHWVDGGAEIWVTDTDGTNRRKIAENAETPLLAWSPDSTKIAFTDRDYSVYGGRNNRVWVVRADGTDRRVIAVNGHDPAWASDGTRVYYYVDPHREVWSVKADGTDSRKVAAHVADWDVLADGQIVTTLRRPEVWVGSLHETERSHNKLAEGSMVGWSPEGNIFYYWVNGHHDRDSELWSVGRDGANRRKRADLAFNLIHENRRPRLYSMVLSPDGTRILYTEDGLFGRGSWVMEIDGSNARFLKDHSFRDPVWSPDGTGIAYGKGREIWVEDADGTNPRQVLEGDRHFWSPDGSRIAYRHDGHLWVANSDGTGQQGIAGEGAIFSGWSADGLRIIYVVPFLATPDVADWGIWVVGSDGTGPHRLADSRGQYPAWSPDGTRIAYQYGNDVWVANPDGTDRHKIAGDAHTPGWSPDGRTIFYLRDGATWFTDTSGAQHRQVTPPGTGRVDWAPWP